MKTAEEIRERKAAYRASHRSEIRAKGKTYDATHKADRRAWYTKNKADILEKQRARRLKNGERIRAREAAYRDMNREQIKARCKAYYITHKEEHRAKAKIYGTTHREKIAAYQKRYRIANREKRFAYHLGRDYGISQERYDALLKQQGLTCAICQGNNWNGKGPQVDHDHQTGEVRGILCTRCNTALGLIGDSPKIARAILRYLKSPPAKQPSCQVQPHKNKPK